jgi:hypothetical protein
MNTTAKSQAAQAIVGCTAAVRMAMLHDPQWVRRMHHGDPTAVTDMVIRVCQEQGLPQTVVLNAITAEPTLAALLKETIRNAQAQTHQDQSSARYWRFALGFGIPLVVATGVIIWSAHYMHVHNEEIKHLPGNSLAPAP